MSEWSLIVFSRTYQADYRFMLIPNDFDQNQQNWTKEYIEVLINNSEELLGAPRWAMFKNAKHLVFGVGCMMEDIIDKNIPEQQKIISDVGRRPIRIFIGYVAKINPQTQFNDIPFCSRDNFIVFQNLFQQIYSLLSSQWNFTSSQIISNKEIKTHIYNHLNFNDDKRIKRFTINYNQIDNTIFIPNENMKKCCLWKDDEIYRILAWDTACKIANIFPENSFSLCIGLPSYQDILNTPFLNATATDIAENRILLNKPEKLEKNQIINSEDTLENNSNRADTIIKLIRDTINANGVMIVTILIIILTVVRIAEIKIFIIVSVCGMLGLILGIFAQNLDQKKISERKKK